ncbi:MAG: helix-turn-helix domain-containing protein [Phycisphaera sp.]|nr:helix-turn-helix domain-containing protein [Phycisphaera sp.]
MRRKDAEAMATSVLGDSMLKLKEVAEFLGIGLSTAKRWKAQGKFPPPDFRVSGIIRWRVGTIERWMEKQEGR